MAKANTVAIVEQRVKEIRAAKGDDEMQHGMEDALYVDVLRAISSGVLPLGTKPADLAAAAVKVRRMKFHRWCG